MICTCRTLPPTLASQHSVSLKEHKFILNQDCPCCAIGKGACPCSSPFDDRCGDCFSGKGCPGLLDQPLNPRQTVSDMGCACKDPPSEIEIKNLTCACCFPGENACPCSFPYHHMCADCDAADDCSALPVAHQYRFVTNKQHKQHTYQHTKNADSRDFNIFFIH